MLIRIIAGIVLIALGAAVAILVPPVIERSAAESVAVEDLTIKSLRAAEIGDTLLVSGRIDPVKNKTFDHEIVVGERQKRSEKEKWSPVQEYRQPLDLMVSTIGTVTITLDSVALAGNVVEVERGDERWLGAKNGQTVTTPCVISSLSPMACQQASGADLFVGSPDAWRTLAKESTKSRTPFIWGVGGLFALTGLIVLLTASSARKQD